MRWIDTWFDKESGRIILLQPVLAPTFHTYRQVASKLTEAGGILLGYRRDPHLEVTQVTEPGLRDIRRRMFFDRRDESHKRFAIEAWNSSGQFLDYVGDWHTHPEPAPSPSLIDRKQWQSFRTNKAENPMLQVIVGTEEIWVGLVVGGVARTLLPCAGKANSGLMCPH